MQPNEKKRDNVIAARLVQDAGYIDIVKDGEVKEDVMTASILVESESDLNGLANKYNAGSIAYTAGYTSMWQLSADGTWVSI